VPNADDPGGGFAGASFVVDGPGRNLTEYDALTFWAKASQAVTIGSIGFEQEFRAAQTDLKFTTNWTKFIIPIPDPSRLLQVRSVFEFAAGGILPAGALPGQGQEVGYSFWIDELKFEKLGTLAQPRPAIMNGQDQVVASFTGAQLGVTGLTQTFNLANGRDETVSATPAYFQFIASNDTVATLDNAGNVTVIGDGTVTITAILNGVEAAGSLTIESVGDFTAAPTPTRNAADVISVFSDAYPALTNLSPAVFNNSNIVVDVLSIGNDQIISYENLSFVGIGWDGTLDVSGTGFLHVDVQVTGDFNPSDRLTVELIDFGTNNSDGGGDDTGGGFNIAGSRLTKDTWVSIEIPINGFTNATGGGFAGSPNLKNVARVVFVGQGVTSILVDNIYFYK